MQKSHHRLLSELHSFETSKDQPLCETCYSRLRFNLSSSEGDHKIDLKTVLQCLEVAQKQRIIPKLNTEWWNQVRNEHG